MRSGRHSLAAGAAILTAFALLTKFIGMAYRLYLTGRIGAEGIGLYQLIMSVYVLFSTFATAGFTVAISRLAAEKMEDGIPTPDSVKVLRRSALVSVLISVAAMGIMLLLSDFIAQAVMNDIRIASPIRVLAVSMPFIALSGCLKGFFLAQGKAWKNATSMVFEQLVKILVSVLLISLILTDSTDSGDLCMAVVIGSTLGEIASFIYLYILYIFTKKKKGQCSSDAMPLRKLITVAVPLAASSYITTILHTGESILIPMCFTGYGGSYAVALAEYGMIRGMVIPLLFFPFSFLSSLVSVLIPELSRDNLKSDKSFVRNKVAKIMAPSILFSLFIGLVFFGFPEALSTLFYKTDECATAMRILALVTPAMYIETISDGMLKALGYQSYTLRCSIYNSILRIVIIVVLIPQTGVMGYLWLLVASNFFTFAMCYFKLKKVTDFKITEAFRLFFRRKKHIPRLSTPLHRS